MLFKDNLHNQDLKSFNVHGETAQIRHLSQYYLSLV